MNEFFRFPHTPHLAWLSSGAPRDDKVLLPEEAELLLAGEIVVEEKLDGANLGFSLGADGTLRVQNRGSYLLPPFTGQFAQLGQWMELHQDRLFDALTGSLIVFGEWCAARHSISYNKLPDWWLMFDVYDKLEKRFWSTIRRNALAVDTGVSVVPSLFRGRMSISQLRREVVNASSGFGTTALEGFVVRREDAMWLESRTKLVRAGFTQAISRHWRTRIVEKNQLTSDAHHQLGM